MRAKIQSDYSVQFLTNKTSGFLPRRVDVNTLKWRSLLKISVRVKRSNILARFPHSRVTMADGAACEDDGGFPTVRCL